MGAILPAVEPRIKAIVLIVGGFNLQKTLPEAEPINFAPRITAPTLMLNGKYDFFYPTETSQLPMFLCLLKTPFLLPPLMLRSTADTLRADDVGLHLAPSDSF